MCLPQIGRTHRCAPTIGSYSSSPPHIDQHHNRNVRFLIRMDERTFKTLELEALVRLLARHVQSPLGRGRVLALSPSTTGETIDRGQGRTTECVDYINTGGAVALGELTDPETHIARLQVEGAALEPREILDLQTLIAAGLDLRMQFSDEDSRARYPELSAVTRTIPDLRRVLASIRGKILPSGEIDDNASPELRRIRRELNERRTRIYRNLESLMRDRAPSAIQEDIVTIRNGRFVIPVRTDSRGQVPGVMHGLSSSGQTTFVEPLTIIDQNNEMVRLREQEEYEIAQILLRLTQALRASLSDIVALVDAVTEIDFVHAKARLSIEFNCVRPQMTARQRVLLDDARHPLLEQLLRQSGGKVVPISVEMDEQNQTMVISGPNAGGKTVVVKTVGLVALMAQMGLHVPASRAELPVFRQVLADIGDGQSIAANLSTFTAHMRNISEMAADVTPPSLILIDEVGTGTDPDEGAALGIAIVDYFRRARATVIATTHYNPLKVWASQTSGVLNASVEFDEQTLRPTYRLIVGVAGASSGIEIARRMRVPAEIIDEASALTGPEHLQSSDYLRHLKSLVNEQESLRNALEEERQVTAEKYARMDLEFAGREAARRAEFEAELSRVVREFTDESGRLINTIKDRMTAARLRKEAEARAAELRRSAGVRLRKSTWAAPVEAGPRQTVPVAPQLPPVIDAEIEERDRVRIVSINQEGTVESINDDTYVVLVGSLRFRARRGELQLIKRASPPQSPRVGSLPRGVDASINIDLNFTAEINVIGANRDEATDRVDKFLDEAYLAGAESVRIVHGHGKGALRRAVAELLSGHPHVQKFNQAPAGQGGSGATVVELKK
jgi:DNA mismatch repair protein MutS2